MRATRGLSAHSPAQPARAITTALSLSEARPIIKRCELLPIDLVGILHGCLQHRRPYSEEVAGPSPLTVAACGVAPGDGWVNWLGLATVLINLGGKLAAAAEWLLSQPFLTDRPTSRCPLNDGRPNSGAKLQIPTPVVKA